MLKDSEEIFPVAFLGNYLTEFSCQHKYPRNETRL